jgi:hypothetical protein
VQSRLVIPEQPVEGFVFAQATGFNVFLLSGDCFYRAQLMNPKLWARMNRAHMCEHQSIPDWNWGRL